MALQLTKEGNGVKKEDSSTDNEDLCHSNGIENEKGTSSPLVSASTERKCNGVKKEDSSTANEELCLSNGLENDQGADSALDTVSTESKFNYVKKEFNSANEDSIQPDRRKPCQRKTSC